MRLNDSEYDFQVFLFNNRTGCKVIIDSTEKIQSFIRKNASLKSKQFWTKLQGLYETNLHIFGKIAHSINRFESPKTFIEMIT